MADEPALFPQDETIVKLQPTQRDANRAMVRVGGPRSKKGRVVATLNLKRIAALGLHVGQAWTPELAERVAEMATYDKAMRQALNRIGRRAMSRRQLDRKLRDLEHAPSVREAVLDKLTELGLLNDQELARSVARSVMNRKAAGPALLKQKLYEKGFDGKLIDTVVSEMTSDADEQFDAALAFARKKADAMARLDAVTRRRRLYGQLARRGFSPDVLRGVMERIEQEANADGPGA